MSHEYILKSPGANSGELKAKAVTPKDRIARRRARITRLLISSTILDISSPIAKLTADQIVTRLRGMPRKKAPNDLLRYTGIMAAVNGAPITPETRQAALERSAIIAQKENWGNWLHDIQSKPEKHIEGLQALPQMVTKLSPLQRITDPNYQSIRDFAQTHNATILRAKSIGGYQGRNQLIFSTAELDDPLFFTRIPPDRYTDRYIIQPDTPHTYMRYVAYIEPPEHDGQPESIWRITEKRGLTVSNDSRRIAEIIATADVSISEKLILALGNMGKLFKKGTAEQKDLQAPRIFRHHRTMPADTATLQRVEPVLLKVIDRLRSEFGEDMRLFCFDVGILPDGNVTIFEFQMPFGLWSYPYAAKKGMSSYRKLFLMIAKQIGDKFLENIHVLTGIDYKDGL